MILIKIIHLDKEFLIKKFLNVSLIIIRIKFNFFSKNNNLK